MEKSTTVCRFRGLGLKNKKYNPGDIILAPWLSKNTLLSPEYKKTWSGKRQPILICLPNNRLWSPDLCAAEDTSGWEISGELPEITITPTVICIECKNSGIKDNLIYSIMQGEIHEEVCKE